MTRIVKDVYTEYFSGTAGLSQNPTAIEFVAGAAGGGEPLRRYILSDKTSAAEIFKSGELLKAIEERIDAGSTVIYAMRLAGASKAKAALALEGASGIAATITAAFEGTWWNSVEVSVVEEDTGRTVEILDPETDNVYSFTAASNADLVAAINAGQSLVTAVIGAGTLVAEKSATKLTGGDDGATLANGDYTAGITASEDYTDVNWVHFVGASTLPLWTAILTSCRAMVTSNLGERFAFLDVPRMTVVDPESPTATEVSTYLSTIEAQVATVADVNAVIPVGEAQFIASDGTTYWNRITSMVSGQLAALSVQESLLAKQPGSAVALCPEWNSGQQNTLVTDQLIHMRSEPGMGLIIGLNENRCPSGSAYNRVEKLRAAYSFGKAIRAAAMPHLGKPNDSQGLGLKLLEADLRQVGSLMVQKGEIDSYTLELICTDKQRASGEVTVKAGVNSMKAMEILLQKVYLS